MTYTIGSLFSGAGGLDMGVQMALGPADLRWVSDIDHGPRKVLAHRFPDAPNLGDVTTIDWTLVEPVDVIAGGSPCQEMSTAGKRAGMVDGTRSGLWSYQADAVAALHPRFVIWENVPGARTARAAMPDGSIGTALGRVTGDLEALGYQVRHTMVRASDVGAPHTRARIFLLATQPGDKLPAVGGRAVSLKDQVSLLQPTPAVNDMGASYTPETWDAWTESMRAKHRNGNGHGKSLSVEVQRLLPTPTTQPTTGNGHARDLGTEVRMLPTPTAERYGPYQAAIERWEKVLGRTAPSPTEVGPRGERRLSAEFCEFMMGLPAGWVTAVPGVTRREALKLAGNGVVPQQAAVALSDLASRVDLLDLLAVAP